MDPVEPTEPFEGDDSVDYNPESIDYEAQDGDSAQEPESAPENPSERPYDPLFPDTEPTTLPGSPIATRSPIAAKPYEPQQTPHPNEPSTPPSAGNIVENPMPKPNARPESVTDQSTLPKSVDLQALLAGLVPARSKPASTPPRETEKPGPTLQNLPTPAMNLPADIMYQLQTLHPQTSQVQVAQTQGPVDIQPEQLVLTPEEERLYEKFLQNEREVVASARWDDFPNGTRMFIGNLPSDRIGKKDIFRLFYPYGRLAQISIKQAYGFVQFYEKADCDDAIRSQQGMIITGRKVRMDLGLCD
jgi:nuclear polyadenylated RNA-binding protein 3